MLSDCGGSFPRHVPQVNPATCFALMMGIYRIISLSKRTVSLSLCSSLSPPSRRKPPSSLERTHAVCDMRSREPAGLQIRGSIPWKTKQTRQYELAAATRGTASVTPPGCFLLHPQLFHLRHVGPLIPLVQHFCMLKREQTGSHDISTKYLTPSAWNPRNFPQPNAYWLRGISGLQIFECLLVSISSLQVHARAK